MGLFSWKKDMNISLIKSIRKANPLIRIEEDDSQNYLRHCEEKLSESMKEFDEALIRIENARKEVKKLGMEIRPKYGVPYNLEVLKDSNQGGSE